MKPFDLAAAKAGAAVCTKDGHPARIICFDRVCHDSRPIVALTQFYGGDEGTLFYTNDGYPDPLVDDTLTLMMKPIKKTGWVNISQNGVNRSVYCGSIFTRKEAANAMEVPNIVDCVKIEWEE